MWSVKLTVDVELALDSCLTRTKHKFSLVKKVTMLLRYQPKKFRQLYSGIYSKLFSSKYKNKLIFLKKDN